ncbi:ATP-grasp domain-containing protein [Micromonospora arida]|uniref:ATP-grasp domain-containing protein n=1 Tax=Micromonospora arida TaxID=2203715 RepID=A0A3N9XIG7_9ACTN|nr:ATP-grasp domain-containing protein [Micromonospora arida]RQX12818.1 hypothetical protein DLJ58_04885 [Micromonospora arida]
MSEAHAFLLLGGYRVIARNWGFLADLAGRGLWILLITSEQWRAETTAAMARGEGPGTYLTDAAFVTGEVGIEGSFTSGVVAHVQRWQQEYDIVGVYAAGEMLVEQTGIVADALGLPGPGVRAARVCRNKYLQRFYLPQWSPRLVVVPPQGRAGLDVGPVRFPAVLKPSGRRSSSGVRAVLDPEALPALLTEYPAAETLLVEEYVTGAEYSVEAVVQHGRIVFESATQKRTTEDGSDWFVEMAHTVPAPPGADHDRLLAANRDIVGRLGLVAGIVHTELRLDRDGRPVLMEVAARTPGDGIMPLYHLATGRALEQTIMEVALDEPAAHPPPRRFARQVYLPQPRGTLQDVKLRWPGMEPQWVPEGQPWPVIAPGEADDPPALRHVIVLKERGALLGELRESGDRGVTFLIDAPTLDDLDDLERQVSAAIDIIVDP